jgi:hypothetical protein
VTTVAIEFGIAVAILLVILGAVGMLIFCLINWILR